MAVGGIRPRTGAGVFSPAGGTGGCAALPDGNAPPIFFVCDKENGPCTVQKKSAFGGPTLSQGDKVGRRELVVRCATKSGILLSGALYRVRG